MQVILEQSLQPSDTGIYIGTCSCGCVFLTDVDGTYTREEGWFHRKTVRYAMHCPGIVNGFPCCRPVKLSEVDKTHDSLVNKFRNHTIVPPQGGSGTARPIARPIVVEKKL